MSKASNKVRWCLDQASRQIASGSKHRGLVKIEPDPERAREFVEKAEHNLEVFLLNKKHGYYDWAINIGFYVTYHCCLAIITKFGYETRNQDCTLALIEYLVEEGKIEPDFRRYLDAIAPAGNDEGAVLPMREKYQYTPIIDIDKQKVEELLTICQDMIKDTKGIIQG